MARYATAVENEAATGFNSTSQDSDLSLALSGELMLYDQSGSEVALTKGLSLVSGTDVNGVSETEEMLRRQQATVAITLGKS